MPHLPGSEQFVIRNARTICEGDDVALIAYGENVAPAHEAAQLHKKSGKNAKVISSRSAFA